MMENPCNSCKLAVLEIMVGHVSLEFVFNDLLRMMHRFGISEQWLGEHVLNIHNKYGRGSKWKDTVVYMMKIAVFKWTPRQDKFICFETREAAATDTEAPVAMEDAATQTPQPFPAAPPPTTADILPDVSSPNGNVTSDGFDDLFIPGDPFFVDHELQDHVAHSPPLDIPQ
jgi:hypothetical protein